MLTFVSGWAGFPALFPGLECEFVLPFFHNSLKESQGEVAAHSTDSASLSALEIEASVDKAVQAAVAGAAARAAGDTSAVLVGWSSGAHILLKCCVPHFAAFSRVLLLAPFLSFTDHVPVSELDALSALVARSPSAALRGFYARCGFPGRAPLPPDGCGPALVAGLEYLRVSRAAVRALPGNVTVVHGEQDAVVPSAAATEIARLGATRARFVASGHYFSPELIGELAV